MCIIFSIVDIHTMSMAVGEILGAKVSGQPGRIPSMRKRGKNT